jgi:hypothetical protein
VKTTGEFKTDIYLLTPLARKRVCCTGTGYPYDDKYLLRGVIHEYSTIVIQALTSDKPSGGWFIYSALGWVSDGYEEYCAVKYSDSPTVLEAYKEIARNEESTQFANN